MQIPPENANHVTALLPKEQCQVAGKHHPAFTMNLSGNILFSCLPGTASFTQHEITTNTACLS